MSPGLTEEPPLWNTGPAGATLRQAAERRNECAGVLKSCSVLRTFPFHRRRVPGGPSPPDPRGAFGCGFRGGRGRSPLCFGNRCWWGLLLPGRCWLGPFGGRRADAGAAAAFSAARSVARSVAPPRLGWMWVSFVVSGPLQAGQVNSPPRDLTPTNVGGWVSVLRGRCWPGRPTRRPTTWPNVGGFRASAPLVAGQANSPPRDLAPANVGRCCFGALLARRANSLPGDLIRAGAGGPLLPRAAAGLPGQLAARHSGSGGRGWLVARGRAWLNKPTRRPAV